jgi:hypothetical protein
MQLHYSRHIFLFNLLKSCSFFYISPGLTFKISTWWLLYIEGLVQISEQTVTFAVYRYVINLLVFITMVESVYSALWTDALYKADYILSFKGKWTFCVLIYWTLHSTSLNSPRTHTSFCFQLFLTQVSSLYFIVKVCNFFCLVNWTIWHLCPYASGWQMHSLLRKYCACMCILKLRQFLLSSTDT